MYVIQWLVLKELDNHWKQNTKAKFIHHSFHKTLEGPEDATGSLLCSVGVGKLFIKHDRNSETRKRNIDKSGPHKNLKVLQNNPKAK